MELNYEKNEKYRKSGRTNLKSTVNTHSPQTMLFLPPGTRSFLNNLTKLDSKMKSF